MPTDERHGVEGPRETASWAVVVITSRESPSALLRALSAVVRACRQDTCLDVIVNGCQDHRQTLRRLIDGGLSGVSRSVELRLWHIGVADKANALNRYIHRIWPGAGITFFLDGYTEPLPTAFEALEAHLHREPDRLAGAAVPSMGPSAATLATRMRRDGGIHGNLFALPRHTMDRLRAEGFRLPVGLYRVDSTIGSFLSLGLRPQDRQWDARRHIALVEQASWNIPSRSISLSELRAWWARRVRQAAGDLENWAVREWMHVRGRHPAQWPDTVGGLIDRVRTDAPEDFEKLLRWSPLRRMALHRLHRLEAACDLGNPGESLQWRGRLRGEDAS